uniref:Uncharacterized protein n=1 Tax=Cannabis sativa TaxID=3483 RepID=A0A803QRR5_CANSA
MLNELMKNMGRHRRSASDSIVVLCVRNGYCPISIEDPSSPFRATKQKRYEDNETLSDSEVNIQPTQEITKSKEVKAEDDDPLGRSFPPFKGKQWYLNHEDEIVVASYKVVCEVADFKVQINKVLKIFTNTILFHKKETDTQGEPTPPSSSGTNGTGEIGCFCKSV